MQRSGLVSSLLGKGVKSHRYFLKYSYVDMNLESDILINVFKKMLKLRNKKYSYKKRLKRAYKLITFLKILLLRISYHSSNLKFLSRMPRSYVLLVTFTRLYLDLITFELWDFIPFHVHLHQHFSPEYK